MQPINEENKTPTEEPFLRLRALGKMYHCKPKECGKDKWKRKGDSRFELIFAIYEKEHLKKVLQIAKSFEKKL